MLKLAIKETPTDRRIAFRGRDFVVTMKERGWDHFHSITPEASEPITVRLTAVIHPRFRNIPHRYRGKVNRVDRINGRIGLPGRMRRQIRLYTAGKLLLPYKPTLQQLRRCTFNL